MSMLIHRYFILNKAMGMESQFVSNYPATLLGEVNFDFPEGIHAIGRLDKNSEGLLLLTTNKRITALLFQSRLPHSRTYLVQVRNVLSEENLERLKKGVTIRIKGGDYYLTPDCDVRVVDRPSNLFARQFPYTEYGASTWLRITLTEGKYHQIRKMVSAVGHRCLR
ncbi:MAG: pseudouridine synthase, partial [Chitinophagaceae bacterium]|nr:pseudouridine synthase [Chitinophagaceae bacterium]